MGPPLKALFTQGGSPHQVALCVTLAMAVSVFPILGTTTLICTALALTLKLNLPGILAVNWLFAVPQLVLLIPFMRLGEALTGAEPLPLTLPELQAAFAAGTVHALRTFGGALAHALAGWAAAALPAAAIVYVLVLLPVRSRQRRRGARQTADPDRAH